MDTLLTKRLILRLFEVDDLQDFYQYAKVEGVGERAGWRHHKSIEETKMVLNSFIENKDVYAIVLKANQRVIGSIGVHQRSKDEHTKEIGYVLSKDYWNQGLMSEAVERVIDYCFKELHLSVLTCGHFVENTTSEKIIKKVGFKRVEVGKYYSQNMDQEFDHYKYQLTKNSYFNKS